MVLLNITALSESLAAAIADEVQKPSIDVFSFAISQKKPNTPENAKIQFKFSTQLTMQGKKEISKNNSLSGSSDNRLSAVAGFNSTTTKMKQSSTNGSLTDTRTNTSQGTVRTFF
jgi:hypothetical protein